MYLLREWKRGFYHLGDSFRLKIYFVLKYTRKQYTVLVYEYFAFPFSWVQFSVVTQSCPSVHDPMTTACKGSLSITNSRSLLKLISIESVMPFNHLILCGPVLLPPSIFTSIRVFSNESSRQVAKVLEFQLQHQSFQRTPRTDLL